MRSARNMMSGKGQLGMRGLPWLLWALLGGCALDNRAPAEDASAPAPSGAVPQPSPQDAARAGAGGAEGAVGEAEAGVAEGGLASPAEARWVGAWATAPQLTERNNLPPPPGLSNNTLRQNVFPTRAGDRVRLSFSNEFGDGPVSFESVHVAVSTGMGNIDASTDRALLFDGNESVTIQPGKALFSDPLQFELEALSSVAITIQFGSAPADVTGHPGSRTTSFLLRGDAASAPGAAGAVTTDHWYYITGIDVEAPAPSAAIVTLGDSITDGRGSTTNGNNRWPDNLARRLQADPATAHISVLNQGIGGNAVVTGGLGPTAIDRFQRDVLEQRNARWVIVLEGVNDIGGSSDPGVADRLISAYQGFIDAAHARGLLIYGVPILPFGGSGYDSPQHEAARQAVNTWVRTSGRFDAVIDLDAAVADPQAPNRLRAAYDSGDGLHLSVAGLQAMADAIDLRLFER